MSPKPLRFLFLVFLLATPSSDAAPLFGPSRFVRETGAPKEVVVSFRRRILAPEYNLVVINGLPDGSRRVSSARVWLNRSEVVKPSDLNERVARVERSVPILEENELTVQLSGAPGGVLAISVGATAGPLGGEIVTESGTRLILPPGALATETDIDVTERKLADLDIQLPPHYGFFGAVSIDLGGAKLASSADLEVQVAEPPTGRPIVARVLALGETRKLALVDTASLTKSASVRTNTPPFPGIRMGGEYVVLDMPADLGILGARVESTGGEPVPESLVTVLAKSFGSAPSDLVRISEAGLTLFIGATDVNGFAAVPGVVPRSEVTAVAISPSEAGFAAAGIAEISVGDILADGLLAGGIQSLIQTLGFDIGDIPDSLPSCPCTSLTVNPHAIPAGSWFSPGQQRQVVVSCGSEDVTTSSDLSAVALGLLTSGASVNITRYSSSNAAVVSAQEIGGGAAAVAAHTPGSALIAISTRVSIPARAGDLVWVQTCPEAHGAVDPVVVECPSQASFWNAVTGRCEAKLEMQLDGTGHGSLTADPAGTSCGNGCTAYPIGTQVQLTATPASGSLFAGWSGDCSGSASTASLLMDGEKSCTATFRAGGLQVVLTGAGQGSVVSAPPGIQCSPDCSGAFPDGASVTLTAVPAPGSTFGGWSGDCSGASATTHLTVHGTPICFAEFVAGARITIQPVGLGTGRVVSTPAGIDCGGTCSAVFPIGTQVTLTAVPDAQSSANWSFAGSAGECPLSGATNGQTVFFTAYQACEARVAYRLTQATASVTRIACTQITPTQFRLEIAGTADGPGLGMFDVGRFVGSPLNGFMFYSQVIDPFAPSPLTWSLSTTITFGGPLSQPVQVGPIVRVWSSTSPRTSTILTEVTSPATSCP